MLRIIEYYVNKLCIKKSPKEIYNFVQFYNKIVIYDDLIQMVLETSDHDIYDKLKNVIPSADELKYIEIIYLLKEHNDAYGISIKKIQKIYNKIYYGAMIRACSSKLAVKLATTWSTLHKKQSIWHDIDPSCHTFNRASQYHTYRKNWPNINHNFDKYSRMYGLIITESRWAEKFADLKPTASSANNNNLEPMKIDAGFLQDIGKVFVKNYKDNVRLNDKLFWPFMTFVVTDESLRLRKDYPLLSSADILRIEFVESLILQDSDRRTFRQNMCEQFTSKYKSELYKLKDKYFSMPETRKLMKSSYEKKTQKYQKKRWNNYKHKRRY